MSTRIPWPAVTARSAGDTTPAPALCATTTCKPEERWTLAGLGGLARRARWYLADVAAEAGAWLALWRFRLPRRCRFRAETAARLDALDSRVDAILELMRCEVAAHSGESPAGYASAAQAQRRRREMHVVSGTGARR